LPRKKKLKAVKKDEFTEGTSRTSTPSGDLVIFREIPLEAMMRAKAGDIGVTVWFVPPEDEGGPIMKILMRCITRRVLMNEHAIEAEIIWPCA